MFDIIKKNVILLFVFIFLCLNSYAFEELNFNGFISDNANILTENTEHNLNNILYELKDKTKAEVAVVTLNSLNGRSVEETALQIFRKYKFGDKKLNNGALFLIAPNERKLRFEIGYGLEGAITDSHAGMILDNYVIPKFKKNDYEKGIIDGTIVLANDISKYYHNNLSVQIPNNTDDILVKLANRFTNLVDDFYCKLFNLPHDEDSLLTDEKLPLGLKVFFGFIFIFILLLPVCWIFGLICFIVSFIIPIICFIIGKPVPDKFKLSAGTSSENSSGRSSSSSSDWSSSDSFDSSESSFGGGSSEGGGSSRGW